MLYNSIYLFTINLDTNILYSERNKYLKDKFFYYVIFFEYLESVSDEIMSYMFTLVLKLVECFETASKY